MKNGFYFVNINNKDKKVITTLYKDPSKVLCYRVFGLNLKILQTKPDLFLF